LDPRGEGEDEPIGAMFSRLVADIRALADAEIAYFRIDFYRRIARAKIAIVLLVGAVLMGQAAAVVLLMSLAFALSPYIGPFGGGLVAALVGVVAAVLCARFGMRQLVSLLEDDESDRPGGMIEPLIERARARSRAARAALVDVVGDAQARLQPRVLIADLIEDALDHVQGIAHRTVGALRNRPLRSSAWIFAALILIVRPPIGRIVRGIGGRIGETRKPVRGYKEQEAVTGLESPDHRSTDIEETSA
jgi:hypothetical protein